MVSRNIVPTSEERLFGKDEIIVSKTDRKGRITYANRIFLKVALYEEGEVVGQQHSLVRHPDMPRCLFKFAWDRLQSGKEVFAYVKNMAKNGDFYWVFAHMTPTLDLSGRIGGYHSCRRLPERSAIAKVEPLYRELRDLENRFQNRKEGLTRSCDYFTRLLSERGLSYDEFVFSL